MEKSNPWIEGRALLTDNVDISLNDLLLRLNDTRQKIKSIDDTRARFSREKDELEAKIIHKMTGQGIDQAGNNICTVSIRKEIVPTIENWDEVYTYIKETGQFELLHRRMAATAYRELQSMGSDVPGVKPKELTRINFRSK